MSQAVYCARHLQQRKPQLGWDAQWLEVFVRDVAEAVKDQSAGTKDLTSPAETCKK